MGNFIACVGLWLVAYFGVTFFTDLNAPLVGSVCFICGWVHIMGCCVTSSVERNGKALLERIEESERLVEKGLIHISDQIEERK